MAWDFSTDPEFQTKLDWVERFCQEKVEPLDYVFPHAVRWPDPVVKAYVRELQQEVKDQGLWAIFLDPELGGPGFGQLKLGLLNEVIGRYRVADLLFVMCVNGMFVVPRTTPGVEIMPEPRNHNHIIYRDVRVPRDHLLGPENGAKVLAQRRLGGGRIHHAMRTIAQCKLAFD